MDRPDRHSILINSDPKNRQRVFEEVYEDIYRNRQKSEKLLRLPARRRQKRISIFKAIIGQGHESILEVGCGWGDLTYNLLGCAKRVVGVDISAKALEFAKSRRNLWPVDPDQVEKMEFLQMSAVQLNFSKESFDWVVSTSMVEHLHPDDVQTHLAEVWRVLKCEGHYLVWCPNGLGHHKDRGSHLSMFSYREWMDRLEAAGFREVRSSLFNRPPMIDARFKALLEKTLLAMRTKLLWSHLGVRNILLVARK
jgi:cyclopropane fatty-acyl-phospholipid synthase-like methyltransferase